MKKIIVSFIIAVLCLSSAVPAAAEKRGEYIQIYSPEISDAYILADEENINALKTGAGQTVSATVFVEESYASDQNGNVLILGSRLLSEDEVTEIGMDEFEDFGQMRYKAAEKAKQTREETSSRGKLTITFSGDHLVDGNSVVCNLTGSASWSGGNDPLYGISTPASGEDFIRVEWFGGFRAGNAYASSAVNIPVKMTDMQSNRSIKWSFNELIGSSGSVAAAYVPQIDIGLTLQKDNMTGGGNTAEIVMEYIHTYTVLSFSIGAFGPSITPKNAQWSISCVLTDVPY